MPSPLDYLDAVNFNTKHFQKYTQIVETFPATDSPDVKVCVCRCWQSKKFPYCDGTHKVGAAHAQMLMENGDNVGPYVAILKAPKSPRTNVVKIRHPLAQAHKNYVANPAKAPTKVAAVGTFRSRLATLAAVPLLYLLYKSNVFGGPFGRNEDGATQ